MIALSALNLVISFVILVVLSAVLLTIFKKWGKNGTASSIKWFGWDCVN